MSQKNIVMIIGTKYRLRQCTPALSFINKALRFLRVEAQGFVVF
jgi:hypothetical protein